MVAVTTTYTPNFHLPIPPFDQIVWYNEYVNLVRSVDALIAKFVTVNNFMGSWQNATAYTAGQSVLDPTTGDIYECAVANTSSSTGTFSDDRLLHPTYWTSLTLVARARGMWAASTYYIAGDFISSGNIYAVALVDHLSSSTFTADASEWAYLIDATATITAANNASVTSSANASLAASYATNASMSESNASTSATNASTSESNAAASAVSASASASAAGQANCNTTSSTSLSIATGSKTFTTVDVRPFLNQFVKASSASDNTKWMYGNVTAWNSGTKSLTLNVTATNGSGTVADWQISSSGATGPGGGSGLASVSADASPSLGGNLSVAGFSIVSASNGDIAITPNGTGQTLLTNGKLATNLNVNGFAIVSLSNGNISITPNGTGRVVLTRPQLASDLDLNSNRLLGTSNGTAKLESQGSAGGVETKLLRKYQEYCPASVNSGTTLTLTNTTAGATGSQQYRVTLNNNATITVSGTPDTNGMLTTTVLVTQDATGSRTLTFATDAVGGIDWGEAVTQPSYATAANKSTEYVFTRRDGETIVRGYRTHKQV